MKHDWLCTGTHRWRLSPRTARGGDFALRLLSRLTARVASDTWIRYIIDLASAPPPPPGVSLTPVTEAIIRDLGSHPDREQNQLRSGLRFWERGLKHAFIWIEDEGPLCVQWLLTEEDNDRLRQLPSWSGMYPPIPKGYGQVENLFTFSTARRKGVASQFEYLIYDQAKREGLSALITHIHASNTAANGWAERTGWHAYGTIRRYTVDAPGLRDRGLYIHRT